MNHVTDDRILLMMHGDHADPLKAKLLRESVTDKSKFKTGERDFDWWFFSKIDQTLDEVYVPYYNPKSNSISRFNPDFIFWMKKGKDYFITFVDPKGTEHTDAYRKIDGFKRLFEENGKGKVISQNGFGVKVKLLLRPEDASLALDQYRQYWFNDVSKVASITEN